MSANCFSFWVTPQSQGCQSLETGLGIGLETSRDKFLMISVLVSKALVSTVNIPGDSPTLTEASPLDPTEGLGDSPQTPEL